MITKGMMEADFAGDAEADIADWKRAHSELVRLAALRASMDWDEGCWLLSAMRVFAKPLRPRGSLRPSLPRCVGR